MYDLIFIFITFVFWNIIICCKMTLKEHLNSDDRFASDAGMQVIEIKYGYAITKMVVEKRHLNAGGICQGGAIFTLADLAFAAAVNSLGNLAFAINSTIYYHTAATLGMELTATARLVSDQPKLPAIEVIVTAQDGTHIATFSAQGYNKRIPNNFSALE